jgi:2-hydroxycyclohexanecarboxyl-CoA dehydrogenase
MTRAAWPSVTFDGSLTLVTGAGSGIGKATALAFASKGAKVLCADIDGEAAEKTAAACGEEGGGGIGFTVDVADRDSVFALAREVERDHGPLDVLVNNAGVGMSGRFLATTLEDWDWILGINLGGVINGCHAFAPAMVARGRGHVVNVSSGLGYMPRSTEPAYCTSKAAVLALSRCLRADWHGTGVGVSAICPGVINTAIVKVTRYRGDRADARAVAQVQRMFAERGHPPELVAAAVVDAVERNRAVVPVGIEARVGWMVNRVLPTRVTDRIARTSLRGL